MEESIQQVPQRFNVRVYGILLNDAREVLISREIIQGMRVTKFPGGGLEFGEGIEDGLKREFREELSIEITVGQLFYVNDFLQISAFDPKDQLLAIYYLVHTREKVQGFLKNGRVLSKEENLSFEWVGVEQMDGVKLSFPVDKVVAGMLPKVFSNREW